jgi:myosin-light-chain kinase
MSVTPGLGAFNKDKVANKFGIQLKGKTSSTTASNETSTVIKNKTISDFRTDKSTNGFLNNTNRPVGSKTPEPTRKVNEKNSSTNKSSSVNINQQSTTLTSNVNHSTTKSKESLTTTKRANQPSTERAVSPTPPVRKPETPSQNKKDQPLYRRQLSKPLDNTPSTPPTTTTSTSSIKRPDALQQHSSRTSHDVVLEDDIDPPFSPRIVTVKKNKQVTDEYELLEFLGRGKFGEVKKCREKSTKHLLAAKFIQINKEQDRIEALNEIEIMKALQHPRLLQLYDAFENKGDICLIMELITGGELFERVIDDDFILTERLCELYMMQICEGVHFMHSCNIIHLDMKPENILCLNRNGHRIKIIDFGLARKFDPTKQLKVLFGTPEFVAPEVINFDRVGYGTDMWSVGVICYVLLSGLSPFMGENDNDTYANINRANYDFDDESFTDISDEAKDFISKLLLKNKDKRLQAKQCLAHPWLTRRPKLVSTPNDDETAEKKLSTKKLRRFVIRRRWQKAVNALLALKRMGMTL